jgi:hypothetical protein
VRAKRSNRLCAQGRHTWLAALAMTVAAGAVALPAAPLAVLACGACAGGCEQGEERSRHAVRAKRSNRLCAEGRHTWLAALAMTVAAGAAALPAAPLRVSVCVAWAGGCQQGEGPGAGGGTAVGSGARRSIDAVLLTHTCIAATEVDAPVPGSILMTGVVPCPSLCKVVYCGEEGDECLFVKREWQWTTDTT